MVLRAGGILTQSFLCLNLLALMLYPCTQIRKEKQNRGTCTTLFRAAGIENSFGGCSGVTARRVQLAFELSGCTDNFFLIRKPSAAGSSPRAAPLLLYDGDMEQAHSAGHPLSTALLRRWVSVSQCCRSSLPRPGHTGTFIERKGN